MSLLVGAMVGVLGAIALPGVASVLPTEYQDRIRRLYHTAAMKGAGEAVLFVTGRGVEWLPVNYDSELRVLTLEYDGETYGYIDTGLMRRYCGKNLGICFPTWYAVAGPEPLAIGEARRAAHRRIGDGDPAAYPVPSEQRLVELSDTILEYAQVYDADPQVMELIREYVKESQRKLAPESKTGKVTMLLIAMGAAFLLPVVAKSQLGGGGGGSLDAVGNLVGTIVIGGVL